MLCTVDKNTACGRSDGSLPVQIETFFEINWSYQETREDYNCLVDETGNVGEITVIEKE